MATSGFFYKENHLLIKDWEISKWFKAYLNQIITHIDQFEGSIEEKKKIEWLVQSSNEWCDIYENFPPGLKDFVFDETFDTQNKIDFLKKILHSIISLELDSEPDSKVASDISKMILDELLK